MKSILTKNQKKKFVKKTKDGKIIATVRYDDECGNGHNTFAITADIYEGRRCVAGGCCHEEIAKHFPELKHLIKWHLVSSDEPMYYIENTTYHARNKDNENIEVGEPVNFETRLKFEGSEITMAEPKAGFFEYLKRIKDFDKIKVKAVKHKKENDGYKYGDNYTLTGFNCKWYECPFSDKIEAQEFLANLRLHAISFVRIPTEWCKAVKPNLKAARSCAVAPKATGKQLRDKEWLMARLPKLMRKFKTDIEAIGFTF